MSGKHEKIEPQDMECKYGGRVVELRIFLNTDQKLEDLIRRVSHHAKGPKRDAILMMVNDYSGDDGKQVWAALQGVAVDALKDPRAKPFPGDLG